ncbi:hypothetical protein FH133_00255 [Staphylococcus hominis]|uniref:hypothetical protein n=1 Tax=Staphylococcus hominis TaxID=1290 RepID=UPI001F57F9C8|nr:hypothetical protein [Staphylococcus hominis]MCI2919735.1 hypothetical protein [Staphylococcus hominis]MDS3915190.1 hypothetical protein [Staphylococcus hominis]
MFKRNEFFMYIEHEFYLEGATIRLISNCIDFVSENYQDDFVNRLYELLDNTIGIELDEIERFYE